MLCKQKACDMESGGHPTLMTHASGYAFRGNTMEAEIKEGILFWEHT